MERRRAKAVIIVALSLLLASVVDPAWVGAARPGAVGGLAVSTWLHLVGYAALAAALTNAQGRPVPSAVTAIGYGVAVEVVQFGLPYRTFSLADVGVNALGACLGVALMRLHLRRRRDA